MFDNFPQEIINYSIIPVVILAVVILIFLLLSRKNSDNRYKYNYIIRVLLLITISLVLPLITGYTIWFVLRCIDKGILVANIGYVIVLGLLIISLISMLVIICIKIYKGLDNKKRVS